MTDTHSPAELLDLAQCSARIGADPLLIQAGGGNTSVKTGDTLWVKASGLWLRDALRRLMFVPVGLANVRQRVQAGEADPVGPALLKESAEPGLRPSIETTLHALMPHKVVLHVHAVDAIAWSVLPEAPLGLKMALAGLAWGWVEYHRPGLALSAAVARCLAERPVDVLLMANHGMVVGGRDIVQAEQRLTEVVARLRRPLRKPPLPDEAGLAADAEASGWRLPARPLSHAIATDPLNLVRAQAGVLYPDHVVFLGLGAKAAPAAIATGGLALQRWLRMQRALPDAAPYIAVPGRGVLLRDDLPESAQEMLDCLARVLMRLPCAPEPAYLPPAEALSLTHWEAEKFRRAQGR